MRVAHRPKLHYTRRSNVIVVVLYGAWDYDDGGWSATALGNEPRGRSYDSG